MSETVTLHSSWKGIVLSGLGALIVFAFGAGTTFVGGGGAVSIGIFVLGVALVASGLFDYPIASTFRSDGVERRALLRRHLLPWDRVDQLTRARPALSGLRNLTPGAITAKVGRRRYLLVDQCESMSEFDRLGEVLADRYESLALDEMLPPPTDTEPTWTYRRSRWKH